MAIESSLGGLLESIMVTGVRATGRLLYLDQLPELSWRYLFFLLLLRDANCRDALLLLFGRGQYESAECLDHDFPANIDELVLQVRGNLLFQIDWPQSQG